MKDKQKVLKHFSLRSIAPSIVTLMAFCLGITAIRFAIAEKWELAVGAIVIAGVFDGLDGTIARLLKATSRFGAELDSLSDIVSFGISPAIVVYLWCLDSLDRLGWAVALIYMAAMALRLARFNSRLDDDEEPRKKLGYLTGVPAPMGASLLLFPMVVDFILGGEFIPAYPHLYAAYCIAIALLMVSSLPTPGLKGLKVSKNAFIPFMLLFVLVLAGLFAYTWYILSAIAIIYIALIPLCILKYRKRLQLFNQV